jgi:hypothetical protein
MSTVDRYFDRPPFYCEKAAIEGVRTKIVRVLGPGEAVKKTPQRVANEMRRVWLAREIDQHAIAEAAEAGKPWKTHDLIEGGKVKVSSKEHGCLVGLADVWPDGYQVAILKCVLDDWTGFMVGAKMAAAAAQDADTGDPDLPVKGMKFYHHPSLPVIRKYAGAAAELYVMKAQAASVGQKFNPLSA